MLCVAASAVNVRVFGMRDLCDVCMFRLSDFWMLEVRVSLVSGDSTNLKLKTHVFSTICIDSARMIATVTKISS